MDTLRFHLRGTALMFGCESCGTEFVVDRSRPFVAQAQTIGAQHVCAPPPTVPSPRDAPRPVLRLLQGGGRATEL